MAKNKGGKKRVAAGGALAGAIALIIGAVVSIEGGYVDHRDDPGGATKFGMTEREARAGGYHGDMRSIPREKVVEIYDQRFVRRPGFDRIVQRNVALGEKMIDSGVNLGPARPACYFQKALNALNRRQADYPNIREDCAIGPASMAAYDALARERGRLKACELMLKLVEAQQAAHYLSLAKNDSKFENFMVGWIDHRIGNVPVARCAEGGV